MKAIISNEEGNNYHALGLYEEAVKAYTYALNLQMEFYTTLCHANIAYTHRLIGKSLEEKGIYLEASEQYKLAHSIATKIYKDENHPEVLAIRTALDKCSGA